MKIGIIERGAVSADMEDALKAELRRYTGYSNCRPNGLPVVYDPDFVAPEACAKAREYLRLG